MPHPPIGIAGAGAVARVLGRLLVAHGEPVVALASRERSRAAEAAAAVGAGISGVAYTDLPRLASRILIAVSDEGVTPVADALAAGGMRGGIALHTSGARGARALLPLQARGVSCGLLHPLQSIMREDQASILDGITFAVVGDPEAGAWAEAIVAMAGGRVVHPTEERLASYHAGAVMASNAVAALVDAALLLMAHAGIDPDEARRGIASLSHTALDNALTRGPLAAVTGPVVRGDASTVAAHLHALADVQPTVRELYRAVSHQLLDLARRRGLDPMHIGAVDAVLQSEG